MSSSPWPPPPSSQPPTSLKAVSHYLKVALEHESRDRVISYWARFAAVQKALIIDKSSPEAKMFVISLLEWLEKAKKASGSSDNEAVTMEAAGEAHVENYALKLFSWADGEDRRGVFNKNVVKAFYTAGILFDILESLRPPLSDEFSAARKYAKWKAAYIHNCLKNGEVPVPGGVEGEEDEDLPRPQQPTSNFGFVDPSSSSSNNANTNNFFQPDPFGGNIPQQPSPYQQPGDFLGGGGSNNSNASPYPQQPTNNDFFGMDVKPPLPNPSAAAPTASVPSSTSLGVEQIAKAQKYCKWASNSLNFDDVGSAIENLEKALHLLKTGAEL